MGWVAWCDDIAEFVGDRAARRLAQSHASNIMINVSEESDAFIRDHRLAPSPDPDGDIVVPFVKVLEASHISHQKLDALSLNQTEIALLRNATQRHEYAVNIATNAVEQELLQIVNRNSENVSGAVPTLQHVTFDSLLESVRTGSSRVAGLTNEEIDDVMRALREKGLIIRYLTIPPSYLATYLGLAHVKRGQ